MKKRKEKCKSWVCTDLINLGPPPDQERWEMSSYRPKKKNKRATRVRGSQGAIVREKHKSSTFGASSNASNSKSNQVSTSKETSHNVVAEQPKPHNYVWYLISMIYALK